MNLEASFLKNAIQTTIAEQAKKGSMTIKKDK